jgi:pre-mRNA-splicing factor 18
MDLLQKELDRKKQALKGGAKKTAGASRYVKASELRRRRDAEEEERRGGKRPLDIEDKQSGKKVKNSTTPDDEETTTTSTPPHEEEAAAAIDTDRVEEQTDQTDEVALLRPLEVTEKLRVMGLPVRLFGEIKGDQARRNRLRQALTQHNETLAGLKEKDEFRLERGHSIRNTFLEKDDSDLKAITLLDRDAKPLMVSTEKPKDTVLPTDPHKRIYKYFKGLLVEWEDDLAKRPEEVKRSVAGKNETKTMQQCRDYISPLFKLCKRRQMEEGQRQNIVKIVNFCVEGEFVKAHDAYLDVAIGRAAWPIGVTMVGIHARTGRAKIESQNVAHVMNSELSRKYLTSIKRLMTFAQTKRPDVHPSKKVMN